MFPYETDAFEGPSGGNARAGDQIWDWGLTSVSPGAYAQGYVFLNKVDNSNPNMYYHSNDYLYWGLADQIFWDSNTCYFFSSKSLSYQIEKTLI